MYGVECLLLCVRRGAPERLPRSTPQKSSYGHRKMNRGRANSQIPRPQFSDFSSHLDQWMDIVGKLPFY